MPGARTDTRGTNMAKVKIMTLRGTGVKGEHVEAFTILELDDKEAGLLVGCHAALFVANEDEARKEAAKRKKAQAESDAKLAQALGTDGARMAQAEANAALAVAIDRLTDKLEAMESGKAAKK